MCIYIYTHTYCSAPEWATCTKVWNKAQMHTIFHGICWLFFIEVTISFSIILAVCCPEAKSRSNLKHVIPTAAFDLLKIIMDIHGSI